MPSQPISRQSGNLVRIPTLDGWRGIAILTVLVSHTLCVTVPERLAWALSIGQHGVTLFFVISGFIITRRLLDEHQETGSINLGAFYGRRAFRILPCSWMYLACLACVFWGAHLPGRIAELVPVVFFFRNYTDVSGRQIPTGHFWSLSIEEQFYMVWPTILKIAGPRRSVWIAGAATLGVAAWRFHNRAFLASVPLQGTFATQFRADALFLGCVAALSARFLQRHLRIWMAVPALAIVLTDVVQTHFTIPLYESAAIAVLLLVSCQYSDSAVFALLRSRWLVQLGVISYSLYVWQQIFIFGLHGTLGTSLSLLLLFVTACLSYVCVERPLIRIGSRRFRGPSRREPSAGAAVPLEPVLVGKTGNEG